MSLNALWPRSNLPHNISVVALVVSVCPEISGGGRNQS